MAGWRFDRSVPFCVFSFFSFFVFKFPSILLCLSLSLSLSLWVWFFCFLLDFLFSSSLLSPRAPCPRSSIFLLLDYWVVSSLIGSFTRFSLIGFTGLLLGCRDLKCLFTGWGFTGFYWVLPSFIRFYNFLPSFTAFYLVILGLT